MPDFTKETDARILIDDLLKHVEWNPSDKSMVLTEVMAGLPGSAAPQPKRASSKERHCPVEGVNRRPSRADYVLLDRNGRPLTVIEPCTAKHQPPLRQEPRCAVHFS